MKRTGRWLILSAAAILGGVLLAQEVELPPSPHEPLNNPEACPECHEYWTDKEGRSELLTDEFVVNVPEKCWACHPQEKLGRSHPIGMDPTECDPVVEVPEEIPLENGLVSCGSCHAPHGEHLSTTKSFENQMPEAAYEEGENVIYYYKTFFLRIPSNPEEGFTPLCHACHPEF